MMGFAQTRTSGELHLVRTARATSIVIAEAYTLSLGTLLRRCHFAEVALGGSHRVRDGVSDVD